MFYNVVFVRKNCTINEGSLLPNHYFMILDRKENCQRTYYQITSHHISRLLSILKLDKIEMY